MFTFEHHYKFIFCIYTLANSTSAFSSAALDLPVGFQPDLPVDVLLKDVWSIVAKHCRVYNFV